MWVIMYTNGGRGLSGFGDTATLKMAKFPFRPMDYSPWSSKNLNDWNRLKKFMQVGIDVTYHAHQFWWAWLLRFRRYCYFQKWPNFPFDPWTIVHGHQKFNRSESAQKIHANRCWCNIHAHQFWWAWPLWFRRYCYFQKWPNFPFDPWTIVHGHQKI